jgi:DNA-directed RNA polymerase specialized sigma24 family protein
MGSITRLFEQLQQGERETAAQGLWERYCHRLVNLAHRKLGNMPRAATDSEDVALSAFWSFLRGAEQGRFPQLADRADLWQVLAMITVRKASKLRQYTYRVVRDPRRVQDMGQGRESREDPGALVGVASRKPDPALAAELAEQACILLDELGDEELRQIALWKMEEHTNVEIAARLGCAVATVERRLRLIRARWKKELVDLPGGEDHP